MTQFIQDQARRPGFMRIDRRGAVENEFPMGRPFIPASGEVVLLRHPGQQPIRKFPVNMGQFFNPICSIDLDLYIQQILAMRAGQVYAGEAKGNQLSKVLWHNAGQAKTAQLSVMTEDELAASQRTMLLLQPTEDNTQVDTVLVINPQNVNAFQSDGDLVTDKLDLKVGEDLTLENNRIVDHGEGDTTIETGRDVTMRTTFHKNEYDVGKTHVVEQVADPQQMILKPNGNLKMKAGRDMSRSGSLLEARGNADLEATRDLTEQPLLLQKTATTKHKSGGLFSSSERTDTTLTHSAVPTVTRSGAKLQKNAGAAIRSMAPQDSAVEGIVYDSPNTVVEGVIAANRQTSYSSESNGFTEKSTSTSQESSFNLPAEIRTKGNVHFRGEAKVNATIVAKELHDETISGIQFKAKVTQLLVSGQFLSDSPFLKVDTGYNAGFETMIPCMLLVEKIIRSKDSGQMLFESVLMDKDRTEVIGNIVKTTYELKQWQNSWCHVEQVVPNEVIVAAAIAITILTKGAGAKLLAPLLNGVTAATGMALSATGVTMVNAGFSAFCAAATSNSLRSGDPFQVARQMVSLEQLKSIGISMASAGLCAKFGAMLKINMEPGIKELSMHMKEQALRGTVDTVLNVAINHAPVDEALTDAVKQIPLKAVAAYAANQIFCHINEPLGATAAHTLLGGLSGFAMKGNRDGFAAGATAALTAQVVGDILLSDAQAIAETAMQNLHDDRKPLTPDNLQAAIHAEVARKADLAKIAAVSVAAMLKKDPNIALFTASNTLDNDITIRQSIYVMAELQRLLQAAAMADAAHRLEKDSEGVFHEEEAVPAPVQRDEKGKEEANAAPDIKKMEEEAEAANLVYDALLVHLMHGYQEIIWEVAREKADVCELSAQEKMHACKKQAFPEISKVFGAVDETVHMLHEMEHDQDEIIKSSKSSLFDKLIALVNKFSYKAAFEEIALPSAKVQIPAEVVMHVTINRAEISSILSSVIDNKPIDQKAWDQVSASVNELGELVRSRHIIEHKMGPHHGHGHGKK